MLTYIYCLININLGEEKSWIDIKIEKHEKKIKINGI